MKKIILIVCVIFSLVSISGCSRDEEGFEEFPKNKNENISADVSEKEDVTKEDVKYSLEKEIEKNNGKIVIGGETYDAVYGENGALIWRKVSATFEAAEHYIFAFVALEKLSDNMTLIDVTNNIYCTGWMRWTELVSEDFSITSIGEDIFEVCKSTWGVDSLVFINAMENKLFSLSTMGVPQIYRWDEKQKLADVERLNRFNDGKMLVKARYRYYMSGYDVPDEYEYLWVDGYGNYIIIENNEAFSAYRYETIYHNEKYYNVHSAGPFSDGLFYYQGIFYDYNMNPVLNIRQNEYIPYADDKFAPEFRNGICKMIVYKNNKFWQFDINRNGEMVTEAKEFNMELLDKWVSEYEQLKRQEEVKNEVVYEEPIKKEIHVMSFTDEVPNMVEMYLEMHPELGYTMKETIIATTNGEYQPALDEMLEKGEAPDIYALEAAFVLKYTKGDSSAYAATYDELGLATNKLMKESKTAIYAAEIGTRLNDNKVVALPYQSTGGCFIYRRSIAKATWGTDEPAVVAEKIGGGSGNWDQFWVAAEELKAKGYGIISGDGDIWHAIENSADKGWVVDGKLYIDPKREALLDISMKLKINNYHNETRDWQDEWYADIKGEGEKEVLGFFGPAWLINYTIADNCRSYDYSYDWWEEESISKGTYGDWAVTTSPVGFCWGGTWLASGKSAVDDMSDEKKQVVADIIQWITLDYDENSLQYMVANGTFDEDMGKDTVVSGTVMEKINGSVDILGGQNMYEYYIFANEQAKGSNLTQYDETINSIWREAVRIYVEGQTSRKNAIEWFIEKVEMELNIAVTPDRVSETSRDLGGMQIIIGDHFSPETPAEPKKAQEEAISRYRQEIFKKYNFTMQSKAVAGWSEMQDTCERSILAGEPVAELFELDYRFVAEPMTKGCFYDLATLEEFDFSEDKWNKSVKEVMTKGNSIYGMSTSKSQPRGGVIWNKRLFEEAGLDPDLPYDLQISGEWTWSKFEELCALLTRDVNCDGATDVYATVSQDAMTLSCLVASTGSDFFIKDSDGNLVNNMGSEDVLSALNFAVELYNKGYEMPQPKGSNWDYYQEAFCAGKAAMQFNEEYICNPSYYGYRPDDEVGFVMPPKPDGASSYYSYVCDNITVIPSCYDEEIASNIAFAYNLYTMTLPEYDEEDDWKEEYYNHFDDTRAVDETIAMFNNSSNVHYLTQALVPGDLWEDLMYKYPFAGTTPEKVVKKIKKEWDAILEEVNNAY